MDADNTLGGLGVCGRGEGGVASFRLLLEDSKLHHDCVVILVTDGFVLIDGRVGLSVGDVVCVGSRSTLAAAFLTLLDLGMNLHTRARFEKKAWSRFLEENSSSTVKFCLNLLALKLKSTERQLGSVVAFGCLASS